MDAVSEGIVRVEDDGRMLEMPRWMIPRQMREGDVLAVTTESAAPDALTLQFRLDPEAKVDIDERAKTSVRQRVVPDEEVACRAEHGAATASVAGQMSSCYQPPR